MSPFVKLLFDINTLSADRIEPAAPSGINNIEESNKNIQTARLPYETSNEKRQWDHEGKIPTFRYFLVLSMELISHYEKTLSTFNP